MSRLVQAACMRAGVAVLVPIGLATIGFGAILAVAGGSRTSSGPTATGQLPVG